MTFTIQFQFLSKSRREWLTLEKVVKDGIWAFIIYLPGIITWILKKDRTNMDNRVVITQGVVKDGE